MDIRIDNLNDPNFRKVVESAKRINEPLLKPAPARPSHIPRFNLSSAADVGRRLHERRMVFVCGCEEHVLVDAAYRLADGVGTSFERLALNIDSDRDDRLNELEPTAFIAESTAGMLGGMGRTVFLHVNNAAVSGFARRLAGQGTSFRRRELAESGVVVIVLVYPQQQRDLERHLGTGGEDFALWTPDAVSAWYDYWELSVVFRERLAAQRKAGKWSMEECDFITELQRIVQAGGRETLEEEIKKREAAAPPKRAAGGLEPPGDSLERMTTLMGAYFEGWPVGFFDRGMEIVLAGMTTAPHRVDSVPSNGAVTGNNGTPPEKLDALYARSRNAVFEQCGLGLFPDAAGRLVVGFRQPGNGSAYRTWFESRRDVFDVFERLLLSGIIFDVDASQVAVDLLTQFFANQVHLWRADRRKGWLLELAVMVERWLPEGSAAEVDASDGLLERLVKVQIFETSESVKGEIKRIYHARIAGVCRAMLQMDSETGASVGDLMEGLCTAGAAQAVVLLTQRLRLSPGFDSFHWLGQLHYRGKRRARVIATRAASADGSFSAERMATLLASWGADLPDVDGPWSPGQKHRLGLPFLIIEAIVASFENNASPWHGKGSLLEQLALTGKLHDGGAILASWVARAGAADGFAFILDEMSEDSGVRLHIESVLSTAAVFETIWDHEERHAANTDFRRGFFEAAARTLPDTMRAELRAHWKSKKDKAQQKLTELESLNKKESELRPWRNCMTRCRRLIDAVGVTEMPR